ncbi:RNA-binding S4 domain-containing protein [Alkalitalea saponilacus]|uniref:Ribosome-associated heat shock protein Hsp15 n=1 Tax=Alkalitalea saponilacus TaxID=889453 RepID=A0A1T5AUJ1_9BACT|nr:RNA-binding S4 domain-containing protein [Alkalitalea saponilacus]ASB48589.1 RNA-binding protein [Alkalitalea saponilacus]SKB38674.1 ribosome-associated heat shock protein Hsp15 [Alkalitalea saponilacus]
MVRIDKYLWAVRLFKTRSIATEACKKGKVMMDGVTVKSSRTLKPGDIVEIKDPPIIRKYKVLDVAEKRMGAKLTPEYIKEVTSHEELEVMELTRLANKMNRNKGTGRPTKKERRDLDSFFEGDD